MTAVGPRQSASYPATRHLNACTRKKAQSRGTGVERPARPGSVLAVRLYADAFNHCGTQEFSAISAIARGYNDISRINSTTLHGVQPTHQRKPDGYVDPRPWLKRTLRCLAAPHV